jgi:hypothetical protein
MEGVVAGLQCQRMHRQHLYIYFTHMDMRLFVERSHLGRWLAARVWPLQRLPTRQRPAGLGVAPARLVDIVSQ